MSTKNRKARQDGKARKMYLVSGHPFGKLYINAGWTIDETGQQVLVMPANRAADAARIEAGARAIAKAEGWADNWDNFETLKAEAFKCSRSVLRAIGALSTKGKKP